MEPRAEDKDAAPLPEPPSAEELYESNLRVVWDILNLSRVRSADREDLAQQVYLTVQTCINDFDPSTDPEAWIAKITWNAIRNYRRKTGRESLAMDSDDFDAIEAPTPDPEAQALDQERDAIIKRALDTIPEEPRMVLILNAIQGFKLTEVEEIIGLSKRTVSRYSKLAKEKFAKAIERLSKRERDALRSPIIAAGAITEAQLDAFFSNLRAVRKVHIPPDVHARLLQRMRDAMPDEPPVSGTRPTNPTNIKQPPNLTAPATRAAAEAAKSQIAAFVGVFFAGLGIGVAMEHAMHAREPSPIEHAITVEPTSTPAPAPLPTQPSPAPTTTTNAPVTTLDHAKPTPQPTAKAEGHELTESALLQRARQELEKGKPKEAIAFAEEHRRTFPGGTFAQDRAWIMIKALVQLGQRSRAQDELAQFQKSYPDSALVPSLARMIRSAPKR